MKTLRYVLISSVAIALVGIGIAAYFMLFGPDRIEFEGRSLTELIQNGDILGVIVVVVVLVFTGIMMLPLFRMVFPGEIKNGVNTRATILNVWDTGTTLNDNPQIGLLLELYSPEGRMLQVKAKTIISRLNAALVQPGVEAEVRYDPNNLKRVRVISIDTPQQVIGASARMEELERLREKGLISHDEYEKKRTEILKNL